MLNPTSSSRMHAITPRSRYSECSTYKRVKEAVAFAQSGVTTVTV